MNRGKKTIALLFLSLTMIFCSTVTLASEKYEYDTIGRLTRVIYDDGMSITYTYDNNSDIISVVVEGNSAPASFARLQPEDSTVVQVDSVRFTWSPALDPNGDTVTYSLNLKLSDLDTSFTTRDTTVIIDFGELVPAGEVFEVTWSVNASDGQLTTEPANAGGFFVLDLATSVEEAVTAVPTEFALAQNYPNPFNPSTQIKFQLPITSRVNLVVYNILGERVRTLIDKELPPGFYAAQWDGLNQAGERLASGIYIYRMEAKGTAPEPFAQTKRMLLLK